MITYNISVEVVCEGVIQVWSGFLKGNNMEEVQQAAFQILQGENEYKKHLPFYEVVRCDVFCPKNEIENYGLTKIKKTTK